MKYKKILAERGIPNFPPGSLRFRVHGNNDLGSFLDTGRMLRRKIENALGRIGKRIDSFKNVLDFGCGCGRVLIWFSGASSKTNFYGVDSDKEAIKWCKKNIKFAAFKTSKPFSPLKYPSEIFDFIYVVSVFTHIDEQRQFSLLDELHRITKPNGILLSTFRGFNYWSKLSAERIDQIKTKGLIFIKDDYWKNFYPEWYQTTYHTKEYIMEKYSKYFKMLNYRAGASGHDIAVFQKVKSREK